VDDFPWRPGSATGIGSLPGTDIAEALRAVLGELPDLPHLPELPARGLGADLIGRGAGLLVDLPVDMQPSGWRLVDRPGKDLRRIRDFLDRDLDTLAELAGEYQGPFKIQAAGPWTLAASLELHYGDKVLADPGATRDLAASLADGLAGYVADVRRRLPAATVILQLDEPSLPAVLTARVPTASGFGTLRSVDAPVAEAAVAGVVKAVDAPVVVHCCAPAVPYELLRRAGAVAASVDLSLLRLDDTATLDTLGGATPAWRSGRVSSQVLTPFCRTPPVLSLQYGRCGAGSASLRSSSRRRWSSRRPAVWRGRARRTHGPRSRAAGRPRAR